MSSNMKNKFHIIGAMSGTSLDGLDLAYCIFEFKNKKWNFSIAAAQCIKYDAEFRQMLSGVETQSALDFVKVDTAFGVFAGKKIKAFVKRNKLQIDFIASHGHTIFHQPSNGITSQIGNGAAIAAESGISTICDFRRTDVALGGQGAPLVPIGDKLLFSEYDFCLNLGGFANVSFNYKKQRVAFDVCPVNLVLNRLSQELGKEYDRNGDLSKKGNLNTDLLQELNNLNFYKQRFPKSLGKEWVLDEIFPLLNHYKISNEDKLKTFCEHIAIQISLATKNSFQKKSAVILCSGGGTYNKFLLQRIGHHSSHQIVIPNKKIIDFKEALLFAFLGVLRVKEQKNCLQSVTGANADNVGGCIYLG